MQSTWGETVIVITQYDQGRKHTTCHFFETQGLEKDGLFDEGRQPNLNRGSLLQDSIDALSRVTMRVSGLLNEGTSTAQTGSQETKKLPNKHGSFVRWIYKTSSLLILKKNTFIQHMNHFLLMKKLYLTSVPLNNVLLFSNAIMTHFQTVKVLVVEYHYSFE